MTVTEIMANAIDEYIGDIGSSEGIAETVHAALTEAGFAIVPLEPTEAMTAMGGNVLDCADSVDAAVIYRAMLATGAAV